MNCKVYSVHADIYPSLSAQVAEGTIFSCSRTTWKDLRRFETAIGLTTLMLGVSFTAEEKEIFLGEISK